MRHRTLFALSALAAGAMALAVAAFLLRQEAQVLGEAKNYTLALSGNNGKITGSYSDSERNTTAYTSSGNACVFSYVGWTNNNGDSTGFGQARRSSKGATYLIPTNGISGLKTITVNYSTSPTAPFLVSFSSSSSGTYTTPVNATHGTAINSNGYDFFRLVTQDSACLVKSIVITYDCSGIDGQESSSSEESSSEETSSESSSSSSSSGSSSSSSSSSDAPVGEEGMILFDFDATGTAEVTSWAGHYETDGIAVSGVSSSGVYPGGDDGARLGAGSKKGVITINFSSAISIQSVYVLAKPFGNDADPELKVSVGESSDTQAISGDDQYLFNVATEEATSLKLETTANGKRVYVSMIDLILGPAEPVYPTKIELGADFSLQEGASKNLTVTYTPENTNVKEVSFVSSVPSLVSVDAQGKVTAHASSGSAVITATATAESGTVEDSLTVTCAEAPALEKAVLSATYMDYTENNVYSIDSAPTLGEAKFLIVPIWFTDSSNYIATNKKDAVREDIRKAYVGTEEETGWHSVKSYYETESLGALEIDGTVDEWYEVGKASSVFYSDTAGGDATVDLVSEVADSYFSRHPDESRKDYDGDGDGYLDGIFMIYGAPDYRASSNSSASNMWAYCYWIQDASQCKVSNPGPNVFFWASYDFIYGDDALSRTGKSSYNGGDTSHCHVDAHTFIHECGHVFGLDDYYDYGENNYSPAGGFSMQDYNVGGHDAFSVMAYGWASPYIPTASCTLTIGAFQATHDLILLSPSWNSYDSPFDEYLLLELYTPTGLNELDSTYRYHSSYPKGPDAIGLRVWHVDARLAYFYVSGGELVTSASHITTNVKQGMYGVTTAFTNTRDSEDGYGSVLGSAYDKYDLLKLVRNSTAATTPSSSTFSASNLFGNGSSFDMATYGKQFANTGKLDSNVSLGWSFSVEIIGTGDAAKATVQLTRA